MHARPVEGSLRQVLAERADLRAVAAVERGEGLRGKRHDVLMDGVLVRERAWTCSIIAPARGGPGMTALAATGELVSVGETSKRLAPHPVQRT
ncbi:hypothetical protein GCM10009846_29480 [Agrococcus versicolor]|uniref:Uncharacterized protein n=1 Tax=Agrococcus versicolor TaxID=501482 RepID=A0ABN3AXK8_9MICO